MALRKKAGVFEAANIREWCGHDVVDAHRHKIGELEAIYVDTATDLPSFGTVKVGLPTRHERTVGEVLALLAGTDGSAVTDADRPDLMPPPARQDATSVTAPGGQSPGPETAAQVLPAGNQA